jgi:hypothetical protein
MFSNLCRISSYESTSVAGNNALSTIKLEIAANKGFARVRPEFQQYCAVLAEMVKSKHICGQMRMNMSLARNVLSSMISNKFLSEVLSFLDNLVFTST